MKKEPCSLWCWLLAVPFALVGIGPLVYVAWYRLWGWPSWLVAGGMAAIIGLLWWQPWSPPWERFVRSAHPLADDEARHVEPRRPAS